MFEISLDDLELIIQGVRGSRVQVPVTQKDRHINIKVGQLSMELEDIKRYADSICWFTGYGPKIMITDYIAGLIDGLKAELC